MAGINLLNEKWPQGTELHLQVVVTDADQPDTQAAIERLKTEGLKIAGPERAGGRHAVARRQGRDGLVHDGRDPE